MMEYGLLGHNIAYSLSPRIHALLGDYRYQLCDLPPAELADFMAAAPFRGLNVTIPYKQAVIPFCGHLSPEASSCGSVNTILRDGHGELHGHNTDLPGFLYLLRRMGLSLRRQKVMILGSGATAQTVSAAAVNEGASATVIVSRRGPVDYDHLAPHHDSDIIVNTTPVGMPPYENQRLLDLAAFPQLAAVIDVSYGPAPTPLLRDAAARDIPCSDGLPLLAAQAKYASDLFLHTTRPDTLIEAILEQLET